MFPKTAFIAITSRCNSRCKMCNFWKQKGNDLPISVLSKLPSSLKSIDITGGEPLLRKDLPQIVKVIKKSCPMARILITSNGLLPQEVKKSVPDLLKIDKNIAFRISLDGWGKTHDLIRGVPNAFRKAQQTLLVLKRFGIKDLGIIYTLLKDNVADLEKIVSFAKKENLEISINLVFDSEIYFGGGHVNLRPTFQETKKALTLVKNFYKKKISIKSLAKVWFYHKLINFSQTSKRPIPCGAGNDFFYLDSRANVYFCHFKNWNIGNLKDQSFDDIWNSRKRVKYIKIAEGCNDCFMICTAKDEIKKAKWKILKECLLV